MNVTSPTKSTRQYLRLNAQKNAELRSFLKSQGCTTKAKIKAAVERAAAVRKGEGR